MPDSRVRDGHASGSRGGAKGAHGVCPPTSSSPACSGGSVRATDAPELGWGCGQDFPEGQESSRRAQGTTRSDHVHKHKSPPGREHQWKAGEGCTPGSALNPRWGRPVLTCPHLGHPSPVVTCPRPMTSLTCLTCPRPRTSLTCPHLSLSQDTYHLPLSQEIPHLSLPVRTECA